MGIQGLWDAISDAGEIVHIAEYAARFFEKHKRPMRIAVNEACWRFTNLTPEQVEKIRQGEPAANPVEKVILWRVLRLMKLNIQLLFFYDGLRRPGKQRRNGAGNKVDQAIVKELHQMLSFLKLPYHQAVGEAEAECAALQRAGIVDAVWSDDGDAFMFGAIRLIKQHKVGQKLDFDADSFLLFALLAGGDYNTTGLKGCGLQLARKVARREYNISTAARHVQQNGLRNRCAALELTFQLCGRPMQVPVGFPDYKAPCNYRSPSVSTPEQLLELQRERGWWTHRMDQAKLRVLLRERYNFQTREFLKHIAPLYLTEALARATPETRASNEQSGIVLKRRRAVKVAEGDEAPLKVERKITFSPLPVLEIDLSTKPPEEDWEKLAEKDGTPYDPLEPVECEVMDCLLRHGLPEGLRRRADPPQRKKRKAAEDAGDSPSQSSKKHKASHPDQTASLALPSPRPAQAAKARKPGKMQVADAGPSAPKRAKKAKRQSVPRQPISELLERPRPVFKRPIIPPELRRFVDRARTSDVVDLCGDSSDEEDDQALGDAYMEPQLTAHFRDEVAQEAVENLLVTPAKVCKVLQRSDTSFQRIPSPTLAVPAKLLTPSEGMTLPVAKNCALAALPEHTALPVDEAGLVPGQAIPAATLRELRAPRSPIETQPHRSLSWWRRSREIWSSRR